MLIPRPAYLDQIRPFYANHKLLKVLVGMLRTGKSSLLKMIAEDMQSQSGAPKSPFLFYNLEDWANRHLLDVFALHGEIGKQIQDAPSPPVIFLDEIQRVRGWELLINSLHSDSQCNLFATSSNPKLLTDDLGTEQAIPYVCFNVFPFSFAEYLTMRQANNPHIEPDAAFMDYIRDGGMPGLSAYPDFPGSARLYQKDLFDLAVFKDIGQRGKIRETGSLYLTCVLLDTTW